MYKLASNPELFATFTEKNIYVADPDSTFIKGKVSVGYGTKLFPHIFLENTTLGDDCEIGPMVQIIDSFIGDKVNVHFTAQIKRCRIGSYTQIKHHCYLGDSKIGNKVNIAAGVITCNYDGYKKQETLIGNNTFIGSNVNLIAPLTIADAVYIGAGSTIPAHTVFKANTLVTCRHKELSIQERSR